MLRELTTGLGALLLVAACSRPSATTRTASGVVMQQLQAGRGTLRPTLNDCVRVRYTSRKPDASLTATSEREGEPATQCMRKAMPGLAEALQQMVVGEERRILVPAALTRAAHEPTGGQTDLVFELTLLEILKAPETPADLASPPPAARRTESGLAWQVLNPGSGARPVLPAARLRVRFSGWTRAGELFESTELSGQPASVTRADLAPGVGEGLFLLRVGDKARLWLPASLAFGEHPRPGLPAGDLTYDVELLALE